MKYPDFKTLAAARKYIVDQDLPDAEVRELWSHDEVNPSVVAYGIFPRRPDRGIASPTRGEIALKALRADLAEHQYPPHRYAWGHYYPLRATSALIAEGAAGKSTLNLAQQLHGAAGKDYLGQPTLEGLHVYLSCEDDLDIVERRAQKIMAPFTPEERAKAHANFKIIDGVGKGLRFVVLVQRMVSIDPMVDRIVSVVEEAAAFRPVVHLAVDTVSRINAGEENATEVMSAVEQAAARIAQALGCACTLLHHVSKAVAREGIADAHAGRGAASFGDNCRSVLRLMPMTWDMVKKAKIEDMDRNVVERGDILKLVHAKLNQDRKADAIYLRRTLNGLLEKIDVVVRTEADAAEHEMRALVEWYLRTSEPFSITHAARTERLQWTKMAKSAAITFLEDAVHAGHLVPCGSAKGGALYVPSDEILARYRKSDPFTKEPTPEDKRAANGHRQAAVRAAARGDKRRERKHLQSAQILEVSK